MKKRLVVIPAYNEEESILKTVQDVLTNAPGFDYIVINDCSTDRTEEVCRKNGLNHIQLPINLGIGGAVQTGFLYGVRNDYDVAVQFDGDGQHCAEYLDQMLDVLVSSGADMVIGSRFIENKGFQSSAIRRIGIRYFERLILWMTGHKVTDPTSGMRMINRDIMELYAREYPKDYPEPESVVTVLRRGKKVVEIPVMMRSRTGGVSSISPLKGVYYMVKVSLAIFFAVHRG